MSKINAEIKKVSSVLEGHMTIPNYQRPYRWTEENVRLLLEDITQSWKEGKNSYRIGSVILNNHDSQLNIVDGQQRITTILLILKSLESTIGSELRNSLQYRHSDSLNAIIRNKRFIDSWLRENIENSKSSFGKYILDYCEFVEIRVADLSEAFQMFDSQNGRGKELEAYNLLKAYHIRAMENNTFEEKVTCDITWEGAARYQVDKESSDVSNLLRQLINEQLYRTRLWSRKETAHAFDKKYIKEFKGITVNKNHPIEFPYQNRELMQYVVQNYFKSIGVSVHGIKSRFRNISPENINPFALVNQNIVNGKDFFDYTETYVEIYKRLFNSEFEEMKNFKKFVQDNCKYVGSHRDGDQYLFELYKSLIILMFDKFGEEGIEKYSKILYLLVYRLRLEKEQVRYTSVAEYPVQNEIFKIIENAKSYADLLPLEKMANKEVICKKNVGSIIRYFIQQNIKLESADEKKVNLKDYSFA
ncbi:hypothetical protein J2787_004212 [Chryseobacterium rhizosphaerae]|uniref:DUF262 domain-containing protein n=1 Tax=Chryseobacterium rhizosphaerae TaxID=395937 RepID=A0AAE3YES2_9FLAO|nr:DUF262 domain-containing protein [Chryseobacterium rhizosphaerae]MDR6528773.1 hypothetical protein [Chryseobacterium rhizosphaerae]